MAAGLPGLAEVEAAHPPVALMFDLASAWAWQTQPLDRDFKYFRLVFAYCQGLRRLMF